MRSACRCASCRAGRPAPDAQRLERIADAIVSIEYYMETLQNGRNDPWYMLDNADTCINALDAELVTRLPSVDLPASDQAATVQLDYQATMKIDYVSPPPDGPSRAPAEPSPPDPQLLELFIEEAKEEIGIDRRELPALGTEPDGSGHAAQDAPQLPYLERQRPHGRCAPDRRIRLVDRESAESRSSTKRCHAPPE
jgi:hypothetical protein